MNQLPEKYSDLILLALKDLAKVEKSPKYEVHMGRWHKPLFNDIGIRVCCVCLAGAVMAKTLGAFANEDVVPGKYGEFISSKLAFLDTLRVYKISEPMGITKEQAFLNDVLSTAYLSILPVDKAGYHTNPKQFKKNMRYIAGELAKAGL